MADDGIQLTQEQKKRQRARNLAIGFAIGGLVLLFYIVTVVKLGPGAVSKPF